MPWMSETLAETLGGPIDKARAAVAKGQQALALLDAQTNTLKNQMNSALNAVTDNKGMLDKLAESGFYMITLDPQKGGWATRLANAANEPPNSGFCTGTANLIISADPGQVMSGYAKLKEAFAKPIEDAKAFIAKDPAEFIPEAPEFPEIPPIELPDWDTAFTFNEWKSAKAGDVFGGAMKGLGNMSADLNKQGKELLSVTNQIGKTAAALRKGLATANGFLADLEATGVYSIMLPPAAGGYLNRLQAEAGAPPSDPEMYCAGFVFIAMAGGVNDLVSKYATLNTLMKG